MKDRGRLCRPSALITYGCDSANQLTRENNEFAGKTWVWTYDDAGNILKREEYAYTTGELGEVLDTVVYTYGDDSWGDLLTGYNGATITYDEIGNPLSDGVWDYTWRQGRQLATMFDGETTWTYTYDVNGMRLSRSTGTGADDVTYTYVYTDGLLSRMTKGNTMLCFSYDAAGTPLTMSLHTGTDCGIKNGTPCGADCILYHYVTNLQGDVIAILDNSGKSVVLYRYDAWGYPILTLDTSDGDKGTVLLSPCPWWKGVLVRWMRQSDV